MSIPNWYQTILLALAAFRVWKLLAEDDILDKPRRSLTRLGSKWKQEGDPLPKDYRVGLAEWLSCPYCSGAWIALAWWGAFEWSSHITLIVAVPLALSALVVYANRLAD